MRITEWGWSRKTSRHKAAATLAVIGLGAAGVWLAIAPASGDAASEGYVFSDVRVASVNRDAVTITYDRAWAGSEAPGWRLCTMTVRDQSGAVMAEESWETLAIAERYNDRIAVLPITDGAEASRPNDVQASCGPRLDDANAIYEIDGVSVAHREDSPADVFRLTYLPHWAGANEYPSTNLCVAEVVDATGSTIGTTEFTLTGAGGEQGVDVKVPAGVPAGGRVTCSPYR